MKEDYTLLPKRKFSNSEKPWKNWQRTEFYTNYFKIDIDSTKNKIYQYSFSLQKSIPDDSELYYHGAKSIRTVLRKEIGLLVFKGKMLWGTKSNETLQEHTCKFKFQNKDYSIKCQIEQTKELNIKDLMDNKEESKIIVSQMLNIDLKMKLKSAGMVEIGKRGQYYYEKNDQKLSQKQSQDLERLHQQGKLTVLRGFKFTITSLNRGLYLQIDVSSRVLQHKTLFQLLKRSQPKRNKEQFQNTIIITNYGKRKTYKIQQIDFQKTPLNTFYHNKKKTEITYLQYYEEAYGLKITDREKKQPLIKVKAWTNKQIKNGRIVQTPQYIYLLPSFVSPTGMTQDQREDRGIMKLLSPFTKLSPEERVSNCNNMVEQLNQQQSLITIGEAQKMKGYVLNKPELNFGNQKEQPNHNGTFKNRNKLFKPLDLNDYLFVYSYSHKRDMGDADQAVKLILDAGKTYGIYSQKPGFLEIQGYDLEDWIKALKKDIKKNGKPQILIFFVKNQKEYSFYGPLKKIVTQKLSIPCQFIKKRTLLSSKSAMSAAGKIAIQMCSKIGGVPWNVQKSHKYFKDKSVMYGGISLSKGSKGYTLGFVGTTHNNCSSIHNESKINIQRKESIPPVILEDIFENWAKTYFKKNKKIPDVIIVYREGLNQIQTQAQLRPEVKALKEIIEKIGRKTKTQDYQPQVIYTIVNKKINSRYYEFKDPKNKKSSGFQNPCSGSVITDEMSQNNANDFYIVPQLVTQGTCTPTHYTVAYNEGNVPIQALIQFTFDQCFNYHNWQGAIRVPACLQSASKLATLNGQHMKEDVSGGQICKKPYFL